MMNTATPNRNMQSIAPAPPHGLPQQQEMSADNDLRAQLAAAMHSQHPPHPHHQQQQQQQQHAAHPGPHPPHGYGDAPASSSASPHDQTIDPAIGGPQGMMSAGGDSGGDDSLGDGRKGGKRELSQSKRAAQNRAAQRAFRQRKEGYIKKLEEQVREFHALEDSYKGVQAENYSLREYIIHLQSRLIESHGEYPPPPPHVNLTHPHARPDNNNNNNVAVHHRDGGPAAVAPMAAMSQIQASNARNIAAAGLNTAKHPVEEQHGYGETKRYKDHSNEDPAAAEDLIRSQLTGVAASSADGLPRTM